MIKSILKTYLHPVRFNSQSGQSSIYIVIIIMVVIFAVMFVGGTESLSSGNEASPVSITPSAVADSGSASPSAGSSSPTTTTTTSPTASPTTTVGWNVSFTKTLCLKETIPQQEGKITASGDQDGYVSIEVQNGESYVVVLTAEFKAPQVSYNTILSNKDGFNTKNWRMNIFSGGTRSGNQWINGNLKSTYSGTGTGC